MLKAWLREPLLHFLVLGAALFLVDAWLRPAGSRPAGTAEIVVSETRVRSLAQNFARTWQRPPSAEELDGLVESYVREEVMYREAVALGLDRDDAIVRRRLQQKVEFISEQAAALVRPTDEELAAYLAANPDAYRIEPRVTFEQVFLDAGRRRGTLEADAKRLLATLNRPGGASAADGLGDRLALLEPRYEAASRAEVVRLFGAAFADALLRQPVGEWSGPVASGYGAHLVRVAALEPGAAPPLDRVRPLVERDWTNARRREIAGAHYESLRSRYTVRVQSPKEPPK